MQVTTDNGDVLYDNSSSPITLKTGGSGYVYYTANDTWGYFTSIACGRLDANGNAANWNVNKGDVNGDETLDIRDLVRYKKYLSDVEVEFHLENADLNGDGKYDALDLASLRLKLFEV